MKRNTLYIVCFLLVSLLWSSCSTSQRIKRADKRYEIGEYYAAGEMYRKIYGSLKQKEKKLRGEVAFKQGECYRAINHSRAVKAYQNAIQNKYEDPIVFLRLAQCLMYQGKYSDAAKNYQTYIELVPDDYRGQAGLYACKNIPDWKKQGSRYKISLATDFNDKRSSTFSPMFIGENYDALMFTSNRSKATRKMRQNSPITGTTINGLYTTRKNATGKWEEIEKPEGLYDDEEEAAAEDDSRRTAGGGEREGQPIKVGGSKDADMGVCTFTADGQVMYFTWSKPIRGFDFGSKIFQSTRTGGEWGEPQEIKLFVDSTISVGHPSVSANGDTLYFVSDAPDGIGGKDIWMAEQIDGQWTNVTNLGTEINTANDEMFPYYRGNGELYFSSNGHAGYGGLDIFKAVFADSTIALYNMGMPFNSMGDDFGICFEGKNEMGYFSSNRNQKKGYDNIYRFELPELIYMIEGKVTDLNNEPIDKVTIRLIGNDGTNAKIQAKKDGTYKLKLAKDVKYVMLASARGYLNQKQELNTEGQNDSKTYEQNFSLSPISKPVTMNNVFYEFAKWDITPESETELRTLVKLLQDNPNITIELSAHTDKVGDAQSNKTLSEKRAQSVVNFLIEAGIDKERLTPVGYGEEKPVVVDATLHKKYDFLPIDQALDETFIDSLTPEQQEIANQINRRTEFKVLKTTYKLY